MRDRLEQDFDLQIRDTVCLECILVLCLLDSELVAKENVAFRMWRLDETDSWVLSVRIQLYNMTVQYVCTVCMYILHLYSMSVCTIDDLFVDSVNQSLKRCFDNP